MRQRHGFESPRTYLHSQLLSRRVHIGRLILVDDCRWMLCSQFNNASGCVLHERISDLVYLGGLISVRVNPRKSVFQETKENFPGPFKVQAVIRCCLLSSKLFLFLSFFRKFVPSICVLFVPNTMSFRTYTRFNAVKIADWGNSLLSTMNWTSNWLKQLLICRQNLTAPCCLRKTSRPFPTKEKVEEANGELPCSPRQAWAILTSPSNHNRISLEPPSLILYRK